MRKSLNCFNHRGNRLCKAKNKLPIFVYRATFVTVLLSLMFPVGLASSLTRKVTSRVSNTLLAQTQTQKDQKNEALRLNELGLQQLNQGQFREALKVFEQALVIFREIGNRQGEGATLNNMGLVYSDQGQYPKALNYYQQALAITQLVGDKVGEITIFNSMAVVHGKIGQYQKALENYQNALVIAQLIGNKSIEGRCLSGIGTIYQYQGKPRRALENFQKALAVAQLFGDKFAELTRLNNIGYTYSSLGEYQKALENYQKSLFIAQEIGDKAGEGTAFNNIGTVYDSLGDYYKALENYQKALLITQEIGNKEGEGTAFNNIGYIYSVMGEKTEALQNYTKALAIHQQIGTKAGEASTLNNIGAVKRSLGQYQKALENYQQALAIAQKIGDKETEGTTLHNIGYVYDSIGQSQKALENYQQALAIYQRIGDKAGEGTTLNNIGAIYNSIGQSQKALDYHQQALEIAQRIGDKAGEGTTLNNIGVIYRNFEKYQKALDYHQQALEIAQRIGKKDSENVSLHNIGYDYEIMGQHQKALDSYKKALAITQQIGDNAGESSILTIIGSLYIDKGKSLQAEKLLFTAIEIYESLRTKLKDDDQKISIFQQQATTYRWLQKALIAQNKIEQALEISERGRARAFVDLLTSKSTKNQELINTIPSIAQIKKIAQQQKATLVEYSVIDDSKLYIWVVKPTGEIAFKQVDLKSLKTPLKKLVETSRRSLGVTGTVIKERGPIIENPPQASPETQKKRLQQLHEILITPIANHLPKNPSDRVIFIPHESLFLVPFPALKDANNKYLIEKHTILTAPAIQVLDYTRKNTETLNIASLQPGDTLLVGNPIMPITGIPPVQQRPLPGTEKEANKIAPILNTQPLIGKQATKSAVLQKISTAKIIHLATHGLLYGFGERIPGAIALAPDTPGVNEGLLKTTEIINLNLKADLVVLSACDTGGGEITGDGVVGLSRSLLTAGAESVIVSLWAVDDSSTSDLMVEFYRQLQQNPDKAKALRQAMLSTMKKHPHPIHWAAFTLIGNAE